MKLNDIIAYLDTFFGIRPLNLTQIMTHPPSKLITETVLNMTFIDSRERMVKVILSTNTRRPGIIDNHPVRDD